MKRKINLLPVPHYAKQANTCRAWLRCQRVAVTTIDNPILGAVPACAECAAKVARIGA